MMLTFLETYGALIFGAVGVVMLLVMQINDFIKTICGEDEE